MSVASWAYVRGVRNYDRHKDQEHEEKNHCPSHVAAKRVSLLIIKQRPVATKTAPVRCPQSKCAGIQEGINLLRGAPGANSAGIE
jgi:hypothetical protein